MQRFSISQYFQSFDGDIILRIPIEVLATLCDSTQIAQRVAWQTFQKSQQRVSMGQQLLP